MPTEAVNETRSQFVVQFVSMALISKEAIKAHQNLYLDRDINPNKPILWDARAVSPSSTGFGEVLRVIERSDDFWSKVPALKSAILTDVKDNELTTKLYATLVKAMQTKPGVFENYEEAINWLIHEQEDQPPTSVPP